MTIEALLPTNQTSLEAALAQVMRPSVDPKVIRTLWDADRCPAAFLPWLAWSLAVDGWELAEPVQLTTGDGEVLGRWLLQAIEEEQDALLADGLPRKQTFSVEASRRYWWAASS